MRNAEGGPVRLIWAQPDPPPRRQALGREPIVSAAIGLADEAGPDALTMQAVAARLGSTLLREACLPVPFDHVVDLWGQSRAQWRARRPG